ncbi:hypothetical protein OOT46_25380 [Aquabacterium sp. A7-Y]|uniref:hypothetical protein n=1 Tax=Aquabacterium sp. A7-Y TaxID=1349605 RepID=UPI00223CB0EF|nr:hypothetical protein [Aquabacterium sp. A7-Y]MCW7541149.1 hypothetical protein [Aquabacterium sp. A7-Y]
MLMALRKDPVKRYPSAEQFSDDVFRHLERLPVRARQGSWCNRVGRLGLHQRSSAVRLGARRPEAKHHLDFTWQMKQAFVSRWMLHTCHPRLSGNRTLLLR